MHTAHLSLPGRVFAIGDIHGCSDELSALLDCIIPRLEDQDTLVFVGDYINRGPKSAEVIDILISLQRDRPKTVFLKGNHEQMLLECLEDSATIHAPFARYGGKETCRSYGCDLEEFFESRGAIIPPDHLEFLRSLEIFSLLGQFLFVHAGIRPGVPLDGQVEQDLIWIRDGFIDSPHDLEQIVVHGHTPFQNVSFNLPFSIGIDTGLVYGNLLSCLELRDGEMFQIKRHDRRVVRSKV